MTKHAQHLQCFTSLLLGGAKLALAEQAISTTLFSWRHFTDFVSLSNSKNTFTSL